MSAVTADTHVLHWYVEEPERLSATALAALDEASEAGDPIYICAISIVEMVYLAEKGKLPYPVLQRILAEIETPESAFAVVPLTLPVALSIRSIPRSEVPDMPDRIIAATALHLGLPLVTRDAKIRSSTIRTIW